MPKNTPLPHEWQNLQNISAIPYTCGWCGNGVAPDKGWFTTPGTTKGHPLIQVCSFCKKPTLWDLDGLRYPAPRSGDDVNHLPKEVQALYDEARDCISVNANTAVVLVCRTIITHVAVTKGANKKGTFNQHIEYLRDNNHLPEGSDIWVQVIREKGGDAAHDLEITSPEDALHVIKFTEMLLRVAIEYPEAAKLAGGKDSAPAEDGIRFPETT